MPTIRAILGQFSRDALLRVLDAYDLRVSDRRVKDQLVDALAVFPEAQGKDIRAGIMQTPAWSIRISSESMSRPL